MIGVLFAVVLPWIGGINDELSPLPGFNEKKPVMNSNHFGLAYWLPLRGLLGTRKVATDALIRSVRGMSVKQMAAIQSGGWIAGVKM